MRAPQAPEDLLSPPSLQEPRWERFNGYAATNAGGDLAVARPPPGYAAAAAAAHGVGGGGRQAHLLRRAAGFVKVRKALGSPPCSRPGRLCSSCFFLGEAWPARMPKEHAFACLSRSMQ